MDKPNCWEFKQCGREPGGENVAEQGVCQAPIEARGDGINGGDASGRVCWVVSGTLCGGSAQGSFAQKISGCVQCDFFRSVQDAEGASFDPGAAVLTRLMRPSELKRAYEGLSQTFRDYRRLFDSVGDAMMVFEVTDDHAPGRLLEANAALCRLVGRPRESLLLRAPCAGFVRTMATEALRCLRPGEDDLPRILEVPAAEEGADPTPVEIKAYAVEYGGQAAVILTARDITAQRRGEAALRAERDRLETVTQNAGAGLIILSRAMTIEWANGVVKQRFGDVVGRSCVSVFGEGAEASEGCCMCDVLERGAERGVSERRVMDRSGELIWVELVTTPVRGADGKTDTALVLVLDITERKQSQRRLREAEERVRQSQKLEAVGRLAGGVAHDFNNLMTAVLMNSEMLVEARLPGDLGQDVEEIRKAAQRAAELTRQLLAFSRNQVLQPRVVHLPSVVSGLQGMLRRLIGEHIELVTECPASLWPVEADLGQLEQVLVNLVVNARDAMPRGGTIRIDASNRAPDDAPEAAPDAANDAPSVAQHQRVVLRVQDDGEGMDATTLERIFEPFFSTKGEQKGTGLGLATVYGIVQQSGGDIRVDSAPGQGTTFTMVFPRANGPVTNELPAVASRQAPAVEATVLVVDDDHAVRQSVVRALSAAGLRVLTAANGPDALAMMADENHRIDLILTDVIMPGMSGRELTERALSGRADTRVLYMSGYIDDTLDRHGILKPGVAFLPKPFTAAELTAKVAEALSTRPLMSRTA